MSARTGTSEPTWVRWSLIGLALAFVLLFLLLPLAAVFTEALRKGLPAALEALREPDVDRDDFGKPLVGSTRRLLGSPSKMGSSSARRRRISTDSSVWRYSLRTGNSALV